MLKIFQQLYIKIILTILLNYNRSQCDEVCYKDDFKCFKTNNFRYLFYDVNPPEGFNLRRDVYMRFAVLAHHLKNSKNPDINNFKLVLPPWSHLVHWRYSETPEHIPWELYFDLDSLKSFAPVIEMHEFFTDNEDVSIDEVYTLQHFEDMFETGNFKDRQKIEKCQSNYKMSFFHYDNITAKDFYCLSYHGSATKLKKVLLNTTAKKILINHAEVALHEFFGDKLYWQARRSMRFNSELKSVAADFRRAFLNSTDEDDNTILPKPWTEEKPRRSAIGGPYLAIHLRRRDFVRSRPNESPSLDDVAKQIDKKLRSLDLNTVFVATDGSRHEFVELSKELSQYKVLRYTPPDDVKEKFKEGGVAILDQIICSHARYFVGTHESTFSFRIQEEREIMGFPAETTFNAFCKNEKNCNKPSVWKIVY